MVVDDILAIRERWHTKRHPFFGALGEGKLPLRVLGIYMAMHWQFVQRALASFGILFTRTFSQERSEEHTSELQSQSNLVCRLLLEKKKETSVHGSPDRPRMIQGE